MALYGIGHGDSNFCEESMRSTNGIFAGPMKDDGCVVIQSASWEVSTVQQIAISNTTHCSVIRPYIDFSASEALKNVAMKILVHSRNKESRLLRRRFRVAESGGP